MKRTNMHLNASPIIFKYAQKLRDNETEAEITLFTYLSNRQMEGVKFRRQHPLRKFAVDIYCHELKLGIEIDGKYHEQKQQKLYDDDRQEIIESYNRVILRFTNDQVMNDTQTVLNEIRKTIKFLKELKS